MKICYYKIHITQKYTFNSKLRLFLNIFLIGVMKISYQKVQMQHDSFFIIIVIQ